MTCKEGPARSHECVVTALDRDKDTYLALCPGTAGTDCDDTRDDVYPGAAEKCDGRDNNCNGKGELEDGMPLGGDIQDLDWAVNTDLVPQHVSVAWGARDGSSPGRYVAIWRDITGNKPHLRVTAFYRHGHVTENDWLGGGLDAISNAKIAWAPDLNQFAAVWVRDINEDGGRLIPVSREATAVGGGFRMFDATDRTDVVGLTRVGSKWFVALNKPGFVGSEAQLYTFRNNGEMFGAHFSFSPTSNTSLASKGDYFSAFFTPSALDGTLPTWIHYNEAIDRKLESPVDALENTSGSTIVAGNDKYGLAWSSPTASDQLRFLEKKFDGSDGCPLLVQTISDSIVVFDSAFYAGSYWLLLGTERGIELQQVLSGATCSWGVRLTVALPNEAAQLPSMAAGEDGMAIVWHIDGAIRRRVMGPKLCD